jgi:hypothetical protein
MKGEGQFAIAAAQPFSPVLAKDLNRRGFCLGRYTVGIDPGAALLKKIPLRFLGLAAPFSRERRNVATAKRSVRPLSGLPLWLPFCWPELPIFLMQQAWLSEALHRLPSLVLVHPAAL